MRMKMTDMLAGLAACCALALPAAAGTEALAAQGDAVMAMGAGGAGEVVTSIKASRNAALYERLFALRDRRNEIQEDILARKMGLRDSLADFRARVNETASWNKEGEYGAAAAKLKEELSRDSDEAAIAKHAKSLPYEAPCPTMGGCRDYYGGLPYDTCYSYSTEAFRKYTCEFVDEMKTIRRDVLELAEARRKLAFVDGEIKNVEVLLRRAEPGGK